MILFVPSKDWKPLRENHEYAEFRFNRNWSISSEFYQERNLWSTQPIFFHKKDYDDYVGGNRLYVSWMWL